MPKPLPKSPFLNERFKNSVTQFGIQLKNSASISHMGNRGTAREQRLRDFFAENLPKKFSVTQGEAVDLLGQSSQQFDIVIYDNTNNFPFYDEGVSVLPAEAVLATVEVKSGLNSGEIGKCVSSSRKLRNLRPFDRDLAGRNVGNIEANKMKLCRYFHCVFAYDTDLTPDNWGKKELKRFVDAAGGDHLIDMVYVLSRGIINFPGSLYREEDDQGGAISSFYFSVLNFVTREAGRRDPAPYDRYITHNRNAWVKV